MAKFILVPLLVVIIMLSIFDEAHSGGGPGGNTASGALGGGALTGGVMTPEQVCQLCCQDKRSVPGTTKCGCNCKKIIKRSVFSVKRS